MGLFSTSRSRSYNTSTSANAPQQVSDGGSAFAFQNVTGDINVESLDPRTIAAAMEFADNANQIALQFAREGQDAAFEVVSGATDRALEFGAGAFQTATSSILAGMESNAALSREVVNFAATETERGREFSAGVIGQFDSFADRAIKSNLFAVGKALERMDAAGERESKIAALAVKNSERSSEQQARFLGEAFGASVDAIERANASETKELSEKAIYAGLALGGIALISRWIE